MPPRCLLPAMLALALWLTACGSNGDADSSSLPAGRIDGELFDIDLIQGSDLASPPRQSR